MNAQLDIFMAWTCHAIPAATGRRCGHVNTSSTVDWRTGHELVVCAACGCTKLASDRRAA